MKMDEIMKSIYEFGVLEDRLLELGVISHGPFFTPIYEKVQKMTPEEYEEIKKEFEGQNFKGELELMLYIRHE